MPTTAWPLFLTVLAATLVAADRDLPPPPPRPAWWAATAAVADPWTFSDFQVLGPLPATSERLTPIIGPERGYDPAASYVSAEGATLRWKDAPDAREGDLIDLQDLVGAFEYRAAFITCRITVTERSFVRLAVRSDDLSACYIDGKEALAINTSGWIGSNAGHASFWIEPGERRMVLKVVQGVREWGGSVRLEPASEDDIPGSIRWLEDRIADQKLSNEDRRRAMFRVADLYERIRERRWAIHRFVGAAFCGRAPSTNELVLTTMRLKALRPCATPGSDDAFADLAWFYEYSTKGLDAIPHSADACLSALNEFGQSAAAVAKEGGEQGAEALRVLDALVALPLEGAYGMASMTVREQGRQAAGLETGDAFYRELLLDAGRHRSTAIRAATVLARGAADQGSSDDAVAYATAAVRLSENAFDLDLALEALADVWTGEGRDAVALVRLLNAYHAAGEGIDAVLPTTRIPKGLTESLGGLDAQSLQVVRRSIVATCVSGACKDALADLQGALAGATGEERSVLEGDLAMVQRAAAGRMAGDAPKAMREVLDAACVRAVRDIAATDPLEARKLCMQLVVTGRGDHRTIIESLIATFATTADVGGHRMVALGRLLAWIEAEAPADFAKAVLLNIAKLLEYEGAHAQALTALNLLAKRDPVAAAGAEVAMVRAIQQAHLGDGDAALATLRPFLENSGDPRHRSHALFLAGWFCAIDGRREEADGYFSSVVTDHPDSADAAKAGELLKQFQATQP